MLDFIKGKTILITGGTGFLGRYLIKELLKHEPQSIRIFSRDEFKQHKISEEFKGHPSLRNLLGDVRDYERLKKATKGCDIVIHAAALKRIDMIEYNVEESVKTNILGTVNLVNACIGNGVGKVIFISTDKACSPVNTYGACKFVSERIITESNFSKGKSKTVLLCVRYGNVINSTGSVIPYFVEKIKKNETIPLTDEKMTRFLITPEGAVDVVLKAIKYGIGGEVFVPKLISINMRDLVDNLKEIYKKDTKVEIVGIRPGEKIHELMINDSETPRTYEFDNLYVITSQIQKYRGGKGYTYLKKHKKVDFDKYSSEDFVIRGEKIKEYFNKIKITRFFE
jgi:FlaA1/EpsC-like NDP-sugar epimerase